MARVSGGTVLSTVVVAVEADESRDVQPMEKVIGQGDVTRETIPVLVVAVLILRPERVVHVLVVPVEGRSVLVHVITQALHVNLPPEPLGKLLHRVIVRVTYTWTILSIQRGESGPRVGPESFGQLRSRRQLQGVAIERLGRKDAVLTQIGIGETKVGLLI